MAKRSTEKPASKKAATKKTKAERVAEAEARNARVRDQLWGEFDALVRRDTPHTIEKGRKLIQIRSILKHGQWEGELRKRDVALRSAKDWITAAEFAKRVSNSATVADLSYIDAGVLYQLAPGAYTRCEAELIKQAKAGIHITQARFEEIQRQFAPKQTYRPLTATETAHTAAFEAKVKIPEGHTEPRPEPQEQKQPEPEPTSGKTSDESKPEPQPAPVADNNNVSTLAATESTDSASAEANVEAEPETSNAEFGERGFAAWAKDRADFEVAVACLNKLVSKALNTFDGTKIGRETITRVADFLIDVANRKRKPPFEPPQPSSPAPPAPKTPPSSPDVRDRLDVRNQPWARNPTDEAAKSQIEQEQADQKKRKTSDRIAKLKADKAGERKAMPLEGKAALQKIYGEEGSE